MNDLTYGFSLLDELKKLENEYSNCVVCFNDFENIKKKIHTIIKMYNEHHCHCIANSDISFTLYPSSISISYSAYVHHIIEDNNTF